MAPFRLTVCPLTHTSWPWNPLARTTLTFCPVDHGAHDQAFRLAHQATFKSVRESCWTGQKSRGGQHDHRHISGPWAQKEGPTWIYRYRERISLAGPEGSKTLSPLLSRTRRAHQFLFQCRGCWVCTMTIYLLMGKISDSYGSNRTILLEGSHWVH